jgi:hypothetical protein
MILALAEGASMSEVRRRFRVSAVTAREWRRRFLRGRVEGLRDGRPGRPRKVTEKVKAQVAAAAALLTDGGRPSLRKIARSHHLGRSTVHRILQAVGPCPDGLDVGKPVTTDGDYEFVEVALRRFGRPFPFELCRRKLDMGPAGEITYCWMVSSALRRGEGANFRSCIDFWWAAMESEGLTGGDDVITTRVFAESYRRLGGVRGTQEAFLDAHLPAPALLSREWCLPQEEARHLRAVALSRDVKRIREELESTFVGERMPEELKDAAQEECEKWLGEGARALHAGGTAGLQSWLDDQLVPRMKKLRRSGSRGGKRPVSAWLLNAWAYNAKASFYATYANAWGVLLGEMEKQGLDAQSSRFMRLWHMQNPNEQGEDVFWGQVLSLHPLSGTIMLHYYMPAHK